MLNKIHIIIPVYNEGDNIGATLAEIKAKIKTPYHIYVIYDFEEDNTLPVLKELFLSSYPITLVKNEFGKGALNAIKSGFNQVKEGAILVMMADLSDDLACVDTMFDKMKSGYDIVCGSRYMKGGKQIGGPLLKKCLSRLAGVSLHFFTKIPTHDVTNSFKMYHKRVLDDICIESNGGFELGMEILIKAYQRGYKITEIPSTWRDRSAGESRFKLWSWLPSYLRWYWMAFRKGDT